MPTYADLRPVHAIISHPETGRHLGPATGWIDHYNRFHRNGGSWFLHGYGNLIVRPRGADHIIGTMGVFHSNRGLGEDFDEMPEAGWIMAHGQSGQGIASEGMSAVLAWFEREHGAQRIVCMVSPDNAPSLRLAEKLGFAALREAELPDGDAVRLFERLPG